MVGSTAVLARWTPPRFTRRVSRQCSSEVSCAGARCLADDLAAPLTDAAAAAARHDLVAWVVEEAITRLDSDRYGTCEVCEDEMDKKRLEAVPWAKRCISCQEKQEQGLL